MNDTLTLLPAPSTSPPAATVLPADRWRPTRAGIVGLWRYWDETFVFHRGRLLLRGPNGSGKSMALELLLPFLLDADAAPTRLTSAAKSRGSLYERVMTGGAGGSRTGFAWVEFSRGDDVFTVGARIRAKESTRKTDLDFFTTSQSVGVDLQLIDERRVPLSRKDLVAAVGDRGRVHDSAEEHRAAVREALFPGFGPDRYASVVTALLALRKEKLSQNLDLDKLSGVLSEALPALDDHDLVAVAEGFERLDRRRSELAALAGELEEARGLASRQRGYARAVVAGAAAAVRSAETRRDDVTRAEREARTALDEARETAQALARERADLDDRLVAVDAELEALKTSDAYREGANLADLRAEAERLRRLVVRDREAAEKRATELDGRREQRDRAEGDRVTAQGNAELASDELRASAVPVGADASVDEAAALEPDEGERLLQAWARAQQVRIGEVRRALADHAAAVGRRTFAESRVDEDGTTVVERAASRGEALRAHATALEEYRSAVGGWQSSCAAIGPERVAAALPAAPFGPDEVATAVGELAAALKAGHAVARRDLLVTRRQMEDERDQLTAERDQLAAGRVIEPAAVPWRRDRAGLAGAPLWRLVDLRPGLDPAEADGLEAALLAAGLLDAWVTPEGTVDLAGDTPDLLLTLRVGTDRSLADALDPLDGTAVRPEVVAGVLGSVAMAASVEGDDGREGPEVVVGLDGTFRLGAAVGKGALRPAELLGSEAQDRRRRQRLAEMEAALSATEARLVELDRASAAVDANHDAAMADLDAAPDRHPVDAAAVAAAQAEARLAEAEDRLAASRSALAEAEDGVRSALRVLTTVGARHQLPTTDQGLDQAADDLRSFERSVGTWARRVRELATADRALRAASSEVERAAETARRAADDLATTERQATEVGVKLATLESTIGTKYEELLARIDELDGERRSNRGRDRELSSQQPVVERRVGKLETELADAEQARERAERERADAHRRFGRVGSDGLLADAGVVAGPTAAGEGITAVLAAAREVATSLEGVASDVAAIERTSARVQEHLHHVQAVFGARADLGRELVDEGWWVLRTTANGVRRSVGELAEALRNELAEGQAELAQDEERLFEQTLAGSVRRALADRIRLANQLVDDINGQLAAVRTAAGGVEVRLRWEVDADQPDAVKAARSLLLRDPADLSDGERASLQDFVRARVDQARAELEANAPWEARLRETLDYRAWHRFTLQIAHRDWDGFQPATARRMQRLSTGERSIILHLPMLAAIAAHYSDGVAAPTGCPRLVLLDELFAGVDVANRAQLFGTFDAWDLDAVFTSDHEWCQYATLSGIAIHHLHPATGDEPVTSTRFTWDGRRRSIDPSAR